MRRSSLQPQDGTDTRGGDVLANLQDHHDAARIATDAGRLLLRLRHRLDQRGADADAVRADGDRLAHQLILDAISGDHPGDAVLSEEAVDDPARLASRRVWIVDPLDGTREFGEAGRPDWAVHVALVIDGAPAAAAVALPARSLTLSTEPPPPPPPSRPPGTPPRMLVSRTRPPDLVTPLAEVLAAATVPMGSAGAKAMAVVLGEGEIYVHAGGQYEWDSAAPVAVAAAAGLHVSRLDGTPLRYNNRDPWLPDVLVCTQELARPALEALASLPPPPARLSTGVATGRSPQ